MATPGSPIRKAWTYRVENIPSGTSIDDLKGYFHPDDRNYIVVKSLFPAVDIAEFEDGDSTATIYFRPPPDIPQVAPRLIDDSLYLDKEFLRFTPVYVPPNEKKPILADIIAVTGLAGHAYGSWAHTPERMWLRDYLPKDAPNARILTYGYPSKLQGNASASILSDHTSNFVHRLIDMRVSAQCEDRPIIFIGHSLGCLMIKKALTDVGLDGLNSSRIPVQAIIFLAAPHRGLNTDALQTLVRGEATQHLISELRAESPTLRDINQRFAYFARDIDILTCYETQPTKTAKLVELLPNYMATKGDQLTYNQVDGLWKREGTPVMMVTPDSASQYYPREKRVPADANHSQIAKIMKGESGIYPNIKSTIRLCIIKMKKIKTGKRADNVLSPPTDEGINSMSSSNLDVAESQLSRLPPHGFGASVAATRGSIAEEQTRLAFSESAATSWGFDGSICERGGGLLPHEAAPHAGTSADLCPPTTLPQGKGMDRLYGPTRCQILTPCDSFCRKPILNIEFFYFCHECRKYVCQGCYCKRSHCSTCFQPSLVKSFFRELRWGFMTIDYLDPEVEENENAITKALKLGNHEKVDYLVRQKGFSMKNNGSPLLFLAAQLGLVDGMKVLLQHGADTEVRSSDNSTPLMFAVLYNYPRVVDVLLNYGADVNAVGINSEFPTALNIAAVCGQLEIMRILLENKANINATSSYGTPLYEAAAQGNANAVQLLIDYGSDIDIAAPKTQRTPLWISACHDFYDTVKLLLYKMRGNMTTLDAVDLEGKTPLFVAVENGHLDTAEILLDADADTSIKYGPEGSTMIMMAVSISNIRLVRLLLSKSWDMENYFNESGVSALMLGVEMGNFDICKELLENGAQVDICKEGFNRTAIIVAVEKGNIEVLKLLLQYGGLPALHTRYRSSKVLSCAATLGHVEMVKYLLSIGVRPYPPLSILHWEDIPFSVSVSGQERQDIINILNAGMRGVSTSFWGSA